MTKWNKLSSKAEYKKAIERLDVLMEKVRTDVVQNELTLLSYLIEDYEEDHFSIPDASPNEVIKFVMQMKGIKQKDLIPVLGTKSNVSKILNGAAKLQVEMLAPLSALLGIPVEALIPNGNKMPHTKSIEPMLKTAVAEPSVKYTKKKR